MDIYDLFQKFHVGKSGPRDDVVYMLDYWYIMITNFYWSWILYFIQDAFFIYLISIDIFKIKNILNNTGIYYFFFNKMQDILFKAIIFSMYHVLSFCLILIFVIDRNYYTDKITKKYGLKSILQSKYMYTLYLESFDKLSYLPLPAKNNYYYVDLYQTC